MKRLADRMEASGSLNTKPESKHPVNPPKLQDLVVLSNHLSMRMKMMCMRCISARSISDLKKMMETLKPNSN